MPVRNGVKIVSMSGSTGKENAGVLEAPKPPSEAIVIVTYPKGGLFFMFSQIVAYPSSALGEG